MPCYPSLAEMLAAHPLTADYLPRRQRRLAASPALGPAVPAMPMPVRWLRTMGLAGQPSPDDPAGGSPVGVEEGDR